MLPLGQIVKQARKEKGLTQAELADNIISRSMLSLIENGLSYPSMPTLEHIADKLEKPITYFLSMQEMLDEKCITLISELDLLIEKGEDTTVIEKINDFITNYLGGNISSLKDKHIGLLYCSLGIANFNIKDKSYEHYLKLATEYLKNTDSKMGLSKAYTYLGKISHSRQDYKSMEHYVSLACSALGHITTQNMHLKIKNTYHLALAYHHQYRYSECIEELNNLLQYFKKFETYFNFGDICMLMGLAYKNVNKIEDSIRYCEKAIYYCKLTENEYNMYRNYINLSISKRLIGDYKGSIEYIDDAIYYFNRINDITKCTNATVEKIKTLFVSNSDENVISSLVEEIRDNLNNDPISKGELICIMGYIELKNGNYEEALSLLHEAEKSLLNIDTSEMKVYLYHGLNKVYEHYNNLELAYSYLQKVNDLVTIKTYYKSLISNL